MSIYPNVLTPPSSNEDSPQPVYHNMDNNSNGFRETLSAITYDILPQAPMMVDPNMIVNENNRK